MADFWTILPVDARTMATGPTETQASLTFFADVLVPRVGELVEATGERPVREGVARALGKSEAVRRYARLRHEAAGLVRAESALGDELDGLRAERGKIVAEAAPGFAHTLADLDQGIADVSAKLTSVRAAGKSLAPLITAARQAATAEATRAAADLNRAVGAEAHRERLRILARLAAAVNPLLSELAAVEQIMAAAALASFGGDAGGMVEEAAKATAQSAEAVAVGV